MKRNPPCHFIDENGHVICTMDLGEHPPKFYKLAIFKSQVILQPPEICKFGGVVEMPIKTYQAIRVRQLLQFTYYSDCYLFLEVSQ